MPSQLIRAIASLLKSLEANESIHSLSATHYAKAWTFYVTDEHDIDRVCQLINETAEKLLKAAMPTNQIYMVAIRHSVSRLFVEVTHGSSKSFVYMGKTTS